jgi:hypothetical protein
MWYIAAVVTQMLEPTSWPCQQYLDMLHSGLSSVPDVSETKVLLFWQLLFKWDITYITYGENSWKTVGLSLNSVHTLFHGKTINILWYIHFQIFRMLCTIMIQTVTDCGNKDIFFTCWTTFCQNECYTPSELMAGWSNSTCHRKAIQWYLG